MNHHRYRLADFELAAEFALPLPPCTSGSVPASSPVRVRRGEVPALTAPRAQRLLVEVARDDYCLEIPGLARYRVHAGSEIVVQAAASATMRTVATYLCSYALAALCCQRGLLVLQATAVACSGRAVLLVGPSGCGKSTLGACLAERGAELLSDDLCIIDTAGTSAMVWPSADRVTLWADCAEHFAYPVNASHQPIAGVPKFSVTPGALASDAHAVHLVLVLGEAATPGSALKPAALRPLEAVAHLSGGAGLSALLQGTGREQLHLEQCRKVLTQARCWQVARCSAFDELPRIVQLIERLATNAAAAWTVAGVA